MNDLIKFDDEWLPTTEKVFTRWVQFQLERFSKHSINDITKDLASGTVIIDLAQALTHRKCTPKKDISKNCDSALKMFKEDGIKLVGISVQDIMNRNEEIILRLIWKLIQHYSIRYSFINQDKKINGFLNENGEVMKSKLLSWAVNRIENYSNTYAFKPYELSMLQLISTFYPDKINCATLNPKDFKNNFQLLINLMNDLKIPCFIFPEDVMKIGSEIDQKILLTQLSVVKIVLEDQKEETDEDDNQNSQQKKVVEKESSPKIEVQNEKEVKIEEKKVEQAKREDKVTQKEEKEENKKTRFSEYVNQNTKYVNGVLNSVH